METVLTNAEKLAVLHIEINGKTTAKLRTVARKKTVVAIYDLINGEAYTSLTDDGRLIAIGSVFVLFVASFATSPEFTPDIDWRVAVRVKMNNYTSGQLDVIKVAIVERYLKLCLVLISAAKVYWFKEDHGQGASVYMTRFSLDAKPLQKPVLTPLKILAAFGGGVFLLLFSPF
ncbi:unnamed protein product [Gordionus sp. m RMFG-2023]